MEADLLDRATEREQIDTQAAIAAQLAAAKRQPKLAPIGSCRNPACGLEFDAEVIDGVDVSKHKLFCGAGCEQEYQRFKR